MAVERALGEDVLRLLATHIGITRLVGDENTTELALLTVNLSNGELNSALKNIEFLVVLVEELLVTLNAVLEGGKSDGEVIAGGGAAALGVKEKASAVRRNGGLATHLESGLDGGTVALGDEVLDGEEERNALTVDGELDGGGGIVNAILLSEDSLAVLDLNSAGNAVKGVGLAGHELGVNKLLSGDTLLVGDLLLDLNWE